MSEFVRRRYQIPLYARDPNIRQQVNFLDHRLLASCYNSLVCL